MKETTYQGLKRIINESAQVSSKKESASRSHDVFDFVDGEQSVQTDALNELYDSLKSGPATIINDANGLDWKLFRYDGSQKLIKAVCEDGTVKDFSDKVTELENFLFAIAQPYDKMELLSESLRASEAQQYCKRKGLLKAFEGANIKDIKQLILDYLVIKRGPTLKSKVLKELGSSQVIQDCWEQLMQEHKVEEWENFNSNILVSLVDNDKYSLKAVLRSLQKTPLEIIQEKLNKLLNE